MRDSTYNIISCYISSSYQTRTAGPIRKTLITPKSRLFCLTLSRGTLLSRYLYDDIVEKKNNIIFLGAGDIVRMVIINLTCIYRSVLPVIECVISFRHVNAKGRN